MTDPDLVDRAETGALLIRAAYKWGLPKHPGLELLDWCPGADAILVRLESKTWLVVPGSGYGHSSRWSRGERITDWASNIEAQWPIRFPAIGESGAHRWAWGFLRPAKRIAAWMDGRRVDFAVGHSRGAAMVQILAWNAAYRYGSSHVGEAHAIASPKVCFTASVPINTSIHVWTAGDDFVSRVPMGAVHVGVEHKLPPVNASGEDHSIGHYLTRFAMIRQARAEAILS